MNRYEKAWKLLLAMHSEHHNCIDCCGGEDDTGEDYLFRERMDWAWKDAK